MRSKHTTTDWEGEELEESFDNAFIWVFCWRAFIVLAIAGLIVFWCNADQHQRLSGVQTHQRR